MSSKILIGARQALAHARGAPTKTVEVAVRIPSKIDVKALRHRLDMSQEEFARRFGFAIATVRGWEQGRRKPEGPARILLTVIAKEPKVVIRALEAA
jgi:putative transcriptional regulator